eukprot:4423577-Alexandrium_andersonii.AAC.1
MSASLVGSEMCIRDRAAPPGPTSRTRAANRSSVRNAPVNRLAAKRRPCPVSYTHLTLPTICSV